MPSEQSWKRRYERAEAERMRLAVEIREQYHKVIDAGIDDMQQQIDALEQLLLNRAALVNVAVDGRKVRFTFTRRGQVHQVEAYADMSLDIASVRRALLEE